MLEGLRDRRTARGLHNHEARTLFADPAQHVFDPPGMTRGTPLHAHRRVIDGLRACKPGDVRRAIEAWVASPVAVPNMAVIEPWSVLGPRRPQLMPRAELIAWLRSSDLGRRYAHDPDALDRLTPLTLRFSGYESVVRQVIEEST
mgnify:CR=1 FL=1